MIQLSQLTETEYMNEYHSSASDVLQKIRTRFWAKVEADQRFMEQLNTKPTAPSPDVKGLRELLLQLSAEHQQVGKVNPRKPGMANDLIQLVKRCFCRIFAWYVRPIVAFQELTIEILYKYQARLDENVFNHDAAALRREIEALHLLSILPERLTTRQRFHGQNETNQKPVGS